jgi:hypothetical protein
MGDLIKQAFEVLHEWPLVQGAVAILVLVIAAVLAGAAIRRQTPRPPESPVTQPAPVPVPVQIESPWLVQHLVEMHLDIENIKTAIAAVNSKLDTTSATLASITALLRRRANRKSSKTDI